MRPWVGLILITGVFHTEAERPSNAVLDEEDASYVVFLQTRLHGENREKSRIVQNTSSSRSSNVTLPQVIAVMNQSNHSSLATTRASNDTMAMQAKDRPVNRSNHTSLAQQKVEPAKAPSLGDYVKAFAALAAETTASVGDTIGGSSSNDESQDEAVGTSAAVGATIGVVVGATVGVN